MRYQHQRIALSLAFFGSVAARGLIMEKPTITCGVYSPLHYENLIPNGAEKRGPQTAQERFSEVS
jgi:hypothetical protein